jgi:hypothetical protein
MMGVDEKQQQQKGYLIKSRIDKNMDQTGQISKAMTLVKLQGRHSFSTSFCVNGNFGGKK